MMAEHTCSCGHTYEQHGGYVRGPDIAEWCEALGSTDVMSGDPLIDPIDVVWNCRCVEYDGPDPDEAEHRETT